MDYKERILLKAWTAEDWGQFLFDIKQMPELMLYYVPTCIHSVRIDATGNHCTGTNILSDSTESLNENIGKKVFRHLEKNIIGGTERE